MEIVKLHLNYILSTSNAQYCTADISNMYLCSLLPDAQYVRFQYSLIPSEIIKHYNLDNKVVDGYVYAKIKRAWYGLKEAGKIVHDDLVAHLKKFGYVKTNAAGLFQHEHHNIKFTLVVDDFGIKYTKKDNVDHLIAVIQEKYPIKLDMEPKQYIGIHLQFDYNQQMLVCVMGDYAKNTLL